MNSEIKNPDWKMPNTDDTSLSAEVQLLADDFFAALAVQFPVCCASDEFHFFPQATTTDTDKFGWDDFSPDAVSQCVQRLKSYEDRLTLLEGETSDAEVRIDIAMLRRLISTLKEQLSEVCVHATQPSFYLSVAAVGLAEALDSGQEVWEGRLRGLPEFLTQATRNLRRVPAVFRDIGCEMADKITAWLTSMHPGSPAIAPALAALEQMGRGLERMATVDEFRLDAPLYAHAAREHIGCRLDVADIRQLLEAEVAETREILRLEMRRFSSARTWQAALQQIPHPDFKPDDPGAVYRTVIDALEAHCRRQGMVTADQISACPISVKPIPEYLAPIRSAAAYSMPPGHPPAGGTFYTMPGGSKNGISRDFRLLTAHETYPGHHLLDASRWRHARPLRRPIEFPLFYEGWASFSEELLFDTGFFGGPRERFLMAKRRFWRAVRGQIDLEIHAGRKGLDQAASDLTRAGLTPAQASSMVRRYALKPAYQLCYTVGRCGFRNLYDRFCRRGGRPNEFARAVLNAGEIGLDQLSQLLRQRQGR